MKHSSRRDFLAVAGTLLAAMPFSALAEEQTKSFLPADWKPKEEGDKVLNRLIKVTAEKVKGAHDGHFTIIDDYAYIAAELNDEKGGESASWNYIYVALSIVNVKTMKVEQIIPIAKQEQKFENETLPIGACFVPRVIQIDAKTLRCYFASENPGKRQSQMYFVDFDLKTRTPSNRLNRVKLKTEDGIFDMQPQYFYQSAVKSGFKKNAKDYGMYLFEPFKRIDSKIYVDLNNYPIGQQALGVWNDTFDTVEIVGHFNEPQDVKLSEAAVNKLPDGTWLAICRNDTKPRNYMFTTSKDGKHWTEAEFRDFIPNGGNSKPTFDKFNGIYYLGWQESTRINEVSRSVFNIDISADGKNWFRKYRFETEKSFQYPVFVQYNGHIYLITSQGDSSPSRKERIMFGMLE